LNILMCSHVFPPSVGGIETVSRILAEEFTRAGASITVVTETRGADSYPFPVVREPSKRELLRIGRRADVVFQNNISLKTLIPLLPLKKPIVVTHQTWLARADGRLGWQDRLKQLILPRCHNVAISGSISKALPVHSIILPNPFEKESFSPFRHLPKDKDIVFMGRLVSDKGCDLLLQALIHLREEGIRPTLSIIGDGPERRTLEGMVASHGMSNQVEFLGTIRDGRGEKVSSHKIMAIPSRWNEPFGVVALEGIAAGCAIVASSQGGLAEAVGPCGLLFPNGDLAGLISSLRRLLVEEHLREELIAMSQVHLAGFDPQIIAQRYLDFFRNLC
jgi:glycogen(starch) synthase